ncbi:TRNA pseudouridine synthase [Actinidia chinensis var. chinensis]|uniref:tRNA pseudouridine(55) synthase n=1 Tax=Actinidia chinensis var. chinensis TaxID=1590841 RepID=A0A2R6P9Q5_ACTCC|nr:TRNA pseudouridine synthase [Actinidia chinensis var. chinensis]
MKQINLSRISLIFLVRPNPVSPSTTTLSLLLHSKPKLPAKLFYLKPPSRPFSTTSTPYPLQYDMIISRPSHSSSPSQPRRRPKQLPQSNPTDLPESGPDSELGFDDWVDRKLTYPSSETENLRPNLSDSEMDKSKRKYYSKRRKRMYGSDSDDDGNRRDDDGFVELKPEVVEFRTLHKREEELYFHDTFAYPWEKDKHYKMVYQLEKKYFPDQCFDKAFLEPGQSNAVAKADGVKKRERREKGVEGRDEKGLVFFEDEEEGKDEREKGSVKDVKIDVSEKKVEEFFKCLKKVPNKDSEVASTEPFVSARSSGLPPKWDSPTGTVVLVNKPKGWTSFTVCGKLRRLIKVKKVGHAGTLDPMATGLLIVCVGKATKVVDSYQGMIKGYSGIFRLGEATSTWDADSPVIQREPWEHIKDDDIKKTAASFCGDIWQVPPMFSAIKVGGEKMYEKARRGESIELSPRRISIFQFDIERSLDDRQNLIFRVICSKGTYIRSLCADFGKSLSSCAHLTALRRDSIGQYSADDAWDFKELEEAITKDYL